MDRKQFLLYERASRDTIDVKRAYIDMAGDLVAGIVLSQIVYWHLPNRQGEDRLAVERDGHKWLAKKREDWWQECRVTPKQADRALQILSEKGLIETKLYKFAGAPTKHVRLVWDRFLGAFETTVLEASDSDFDQRGKSKGGDFDQRGKSVDFDQRGMSDLDQRAISFTETTNTETTSTEITSTENDDNFGIVVKLAEAGLDHELSQTEGELLQALYDEHAELEPSQWEYVFREAARSNVRNLRYVEGILKNLGQPKDEKAWYKQYQEYIKK
jgi:hypothetical protein